MSISLKRVWGVMIRHLFSWSRDLESLAESFWWPSFDVFLWGLTTVYLLRNEGIIPAFVSFFIGAIILWMFVYRAQQELGFIFLKEIWERNFLNMFTSPLTVWEFSGAALSLGIIKLLISAVWMVILAYFLFTFNIFAMGFWLIPFIVNLLVVGWSAGFVIDGLLLRYGNRVQAFTWSLILIIQPFSAVFYPVSIMPQWMQTIAYLLPTSHIFEGMRSVLIHGSINYQALLIASVLNIIYLTASLIFFAGSFRKAQETGMLVKLS